MKSSLLLLIFEKSTSDEHQQNFGRLFINENKITGKTLEAKVDIGGLRNQLYHRLYLLSNIRDSIPILLRTI